MCIRSCKIFSIRRTLGIEVITWSALLSSCIRGLAWRTSLEGRGLRGRMVACSGSRWWTLFFSDRLLAVAQGHPSSRTLDVVIFLSVDTASAPPQFCASAYVGSRVRLGLRSGEYVDGYVGALESAGGP